MAKVLIVDDDPDILFVVASALEASGHDVETLLDPGAVNALASTQPFDAIVLDVMMPGLSGYDVLHLLRSEPSLARIPVLFLSAQADSQHRIRGLREGADDFLSKPFIPDELVLRIERLASQGSGARPRSEAVSPALKESLREKRVVGKAFLGRYQILEVIGEGAMGLVFRGWDPLLKRQVALKTLRLDTAQDDAAYQQRVMQLLREATTIARFSHPNLVAIYDVGESMEVPFIAMELVHGASLADFLRARGKLAPDSALQLAQGIALGLEAAHRHHIVHQDVKPGNVLLGQDGAIKLTDFGVAQLASSLRNRTAGLFGTPGFLPPETLQGERMDARGDLFSFGALLYEVLTGHEAFPGRTLRERIFSTLETELPHLHSVDPAIPQPLCDLVAELLAKNPQDRPANAHQVAVQLSAMMPAEFAPWHPDLSDLSPWFVNPSGSSHQSSMYIATEELSPCKS